MWRDGEGAGCPFRVDFPNPAAQGRFAPSNPQREPATAPAPVPKKYSPGPGPRACFADSADTAGSGLRDDRGALERRLEGRDHGILEGVTITLEQHPPLESTRAHNGKTGQDLFAPAPKIGRQQCHLWQKAWKRTRFGDDLVHEDPAT